MSVLAISPVPFVNGSSMSVPGSQAQSHTQDDDLENGETAISATGAAAQAFAAFPPNVQPIASLTATNDVQQAAPADLGADSSISPAQWSGALVDVYA